MPYITASIILQLLVVVSPSLEKLAEGRRGRAGADHAVHALPDRRPRRRAGGRLHVPVPLAESAGGTPAFETFNVGPVILVVLCLTAGSVLVMWMGELITQRGIGNGISLMIFASIVARLPHGVQAWWTNPDRSSRSSMPFLAHRRGRGGRVHPGGPAPDADPVRQARDRPSHEPGGQTYLPLRVNMAGVIPVIFAASIMAFPPTIGQLVPGVEGLATFFNPGGWPTSRRRR